MGRMLLREEVAPRTAADPQADCAVNPETSGAATIRYEYADFGILGEVPIHNCRQTVSAPRGKAGARLNAHTELRAKRQRSAPGPKYRNRPIRNHRAGEGFSGCKA
jgi:hypothetical protein